MRAAVRRRYGPPEVVHITDVPVPEVGPGEVRVAVHATTVNRTDWGARDAFAALSAGQAVLSSKHIEVSITSRDALRMVVGADVDVTPVGITGMGLAGLFRNTAARYLQSGGDDLRHRAADVPAAEQRG